jgi:hypothetical protein
MSYSERLRVPAIWWVVGMFFPLTFVTAVGFYAGPSVALIAGGVTAVGVAAALLWYGKVRVAVDAAGLHAGAALLEWPYAGEVRIRDRAATRDRLGAGADHDAWLLVRAFIPGSVEVAITDAADPHPYWLVSSRNPALLAQAIEARRAISASGGGPGRG